jgi:ABC-type nitrate/sulfonate/bicarbonate transport system permease component
MKMQGRKFYYTNGVEDNRYFHKQDFNCLRVCMKEQRKTTQSLSVLLDSQFVLIPHLLMWDFMTVSDSCCDMKTPGCVSVVHYIFNATPDCEVIHGALYSCLRAMFGLSVIGILVCIFSCMLIYQLLR